MDYAARVSDLISIFGRDKLSKKMGVSVGTISRYAAGKSNPSKATKEKANRLWSREKPKIDIEAIQAKTAKRKKAVELSRITRMKKSILQRDMPIYEYMQTVVNRRFDMDNENALYQFFESLPYDWSFQWYGASNLFPPLESRFNVMNEDIENGGSQLVIILAMGEKSVAQSFLDRIAISKQRGFYKIHPVSRAMMITTGFSRATTHDERFRIANQIASMIPIRNNVRPISMLGYLFKQPD